MSVELDADVERSLRKRLRRGEIDRVLRHLRRLAAELDADPFRGDLLRRRLVPRTLAHLPNVWRTELPGSWRALYTVAGFPGRGVVVRIVWIGDHREYDGLFGYR